MIPAEQPQEENTPDLIEYIHNIINHLDSKKAEAQKFLGEQKYLKAHETFNNALNHYEVHRNDLSRLQVNLTPSVRALNSQDYKDQQDIYREKLDVLINIVKKLNDDKESNAEKAEKQANEALRQKEIIRSEAEIRRLERLLADENERLTQLFAQRFDIERETSEAQEIVVDSIDEAFNMTLLAGFITALGVAAVAIAFTALNLAGLALPGVALAGFGLVTTMIGCSIFCSSANSVDEYTSNIYKSLTASTAS